MTLDLRRRQEYQAMDRCDPITRI